MHKWNFSLMLQMKGVCVGELESHTENKTEKSRNEDKNSF